MSGKDTRYMSLSVTSTRISLSLWSRGIPMYIRHCVISMDMLSFYSAAIVTRTFERSRLCAAIYRGQTHLYYQTPPTSREYHEYHRPPSSPWAPDSPAIPSKDWSNKHL